MRPAAHVASRRKRSAQLAAEKTQTSARDALLGAVLGIHICKDLADPAKEHQASRPARFLEFIFPDMVCHEVKGSDGQHEDDERWQQKRVKFHRA